MNNVPTVNRKQLLSGTGTLPETLGLLLGALWPLPATEGGCAGCPSRRVGALVEVGGPTHPVVLEAGVPKASSLLLPCLHTQTGRCAFLTHCSNTDTITADIRSLCIASLSQESQGCLPVGLSNESHDRVANADLSRLTAKAVMSSETQEHLGSQQRSQKRRLQHLPLVTHHQCREWLLLTWLWPGALLIHHHQQHLHPLCMSQENLSHHKQRTATIAFR